MKNYRKILQGMKVAFFKVCYNYTYRTYWIDGIVLLSDDYYDWNNFMCCTCSDNTAGWINEGRTNYKYTNVYENLYDSGYNSGYVSVIEWWMHYYELYYTFKAVILLTFFYNTKIDKGMVYGLS